MVTGVDDDGMRCRECIPPPPPPPFVRGEIVFHDGLRRTVVVLIFHSMRSSAQSVSSWYCFTPELVYFLDDATGNVTNMVMVGVLFKLGRRRIATARRDKIVVFLEACRDWRRWLREIEIERERATRCHSVNSLRV